MRQPKSLDEAKAMVVEEKAKLTTAISTIIGSRWLLAILATFVIAFAIHLAYAPDRLPHVSGLSLSQAGLPSDLDFGVVGEQAAQARDAALRQGAPDKVQAFLSSHAAQIPLFNAIGLGACLVLLLINMTVMTKRRRYTKG
jgi:hypothetical protein